MSKSVNCSNRRSSRLVTGALLAFAVVTAVGTLGLGGCMSAVADNDDRGSRHYVDTLIAKEVIRGSFSGDMMQEATVPGGVRELTLVDAPPAAGGDNAVVPADATQNGTSAVQPAAATPEPRSTTGPATMSASTRPNDIGLSASRLNEAEPIFDLSLQEAIARALKNALSIQVEAYNPAIRETQIIAAEAIFDPVIYAQTQWQSLDEPALFVGQGQNGSSLNHQLGIKTLLPSGATVQFSATHDYRYINTSPENSIPLLRTSYTDNLNLTITQPLLRGFGADVTEANIFIAQKERKIADATFKRQVITTVADVEAAYMNLLLARTSVAIQQHLLEATEVTYDRVWARFIDADAISISQSRAAVEARRAELIRARVSLRNQSDTLKSLLNDPEINIRDNSLINPTDRPTAERIYVSTADSIETALHQRTELTEARLKVEESGIAVKVAKNDLLPKIDLTVGMQSSSLDGRFDRAFGDTFTGDFLDFNAGIRLEFPLGNRLAEAKHNETKITQRQALTQMVRVAQTVVQDVKQQLRDMLSSQVEIEARESARLRAAEELQAITQKERISALTPEFLQLKLDSQSRLATAEQNLIQSLVNYNIAIMRFEQSKGTLLEFNRISLDRAPISRHSDDDNKIRFLGQTYTKDTKK